jgi:glycosyltransferase involved in cell wall biosynthesis
VAVSDLVRREYLAKSAALDPRKTVVIPNGVDLAKVTGPSREAARSALGLHDEILFLSLSRHCLQKNTYALVDAFQDVARVLPSAHLLVCGRMDEPVYTRQILALREQSPVRDRIHLRDNAQRTDVLLAAADVFVLDSFFEGWALASMEALAAGVPVVLSDVGGAREQLSSGVAGGALVGNPAGSPLGLTWEAMLRARYQRQPNRDELVAAMLRVARGDGLATRAEIATDARDRFSATRSVAAHAELLRRVAARSTPTLSPAAG